MTPRTAATNFLTALQRVPGWESMPPTLAAHATQHNADPYHYEPYWDDAVRIVATLAGDPRLADKLPPRGDLPCAPGAGGPLTGPGGSFPPEACSAPDPTTGRGCLTARTLNLATQLQQQGWSISCWDAHAWNPTSDHPQGRACDVFPGKGGALPTAAQKATGDALAADLQATAAQTGVH
jgi:DNA-binding transcriptional LysR family regulator